MSDTIHIEKTGKHPYITYRIYMNSHCIYMTNNLENAEKIVQAFVHDSGIDNISTIDYTPHKKAKPNCVWTTSPPSKPGYYWGSRQRN